MDPKYKIKSRVLVKGVARGPALVSCETISFLGDLEILTGNVVGELPSVKGESIAGKILLMPGSRGSAGSWRFLYQMYKHNTHPLALLSKSPPDPSVVQGAILSGIPILCDFEEDILEIIKNNDLVEITEDGTINIFSQENNKK